MSQASPLLPEPFRTAVRLYEIACEEVSREVDLDDLSMWRDTIFELLAPAGYFEPGQAHLYRAHCRELIGRMKRGERLGAATRAEAVALLRPSRLAEKRPIDGVDFYRAVYEAVAGDSDLDGCYADALEAARLKVPEWRQE